MITTEFSTAFPTIFSKSDLFKAVFLFCHHIGVEDEEEQEKLIFYSFLR